MTPFFFTKNLVCISVETGVKARFPVYEIHEKSQVTERGRKMLLGDSELHARD